MTPSRRALGLLGAVAGLLLAAVPGHGQADPCALPGPLAPVELLGSESGLGGTGLGGDESGIGGTGRSGDESGIGGTGHSESGSGVGGSGVVQGESGLGGTGIARQESGLGGTGATEDPSGIGGTGIYGTLTAFGSVCVNGLRVEYPEDVIVEWNGETRDASALALGQLLWVVAEGAPGELSTSKIAIHSAVVGEISGFDPESRRLQVAESEVQVPEGVYLGEGLSFDALEIGDRVDVSGLRNAEGVIMASRIDWASRRDRNVSAPPKPEALVATARGLRWVSIEGFVTGRPQHPRLGGMPLDLSVVRGLRDAVPKARPVRARGRLLPGGVLRVEPVRPPARGGMVPLPKVVPRPPVAPQPEVVPRPQVPSKPNVRTAPLRPDVIRPVKPPPRPAPVRPERPPTIRPVIRDLLSGATPRR